MLVWVLNALYNFDEGGKSKARELIYILLGRGDGRKIVV